MTTPPLLAVVLTFTAALAHRSRRRLRLPSSIGSMARSIVDLGLRSRRLARGTRLP
jgi:hypothetical protein